MPGSHAQQKKGINSTRKAVITREQMDSYKAGKAENVWPHAPLHGRVRLDAGPNTDLAVIFSKNFHDCVRRHIQSFRFSSYELHNHDLENLYVLLFASNSNIYRFFYLAPVYNFLYVHDIESCGCISENITHQEWFCIITRLMYCLGVSAIISFFCAPILVSFIFLILIAPCGILGAIVDCRRRCENYLFFTRGNGLARPLEKALNFFDPEKLTKLINRIEIAETMAIAGFYTMSLLEFSFRMAILLAVASFFCWSFGVPAVNIFIILYVAAGSLGLSLFLDFIVYPCLKFIRDYCINSIKTMPAPFIEANDRYLAEKNSEISYIHTIWQQEHDAAFRKEPYSPNFKKS